MSYEDGELLLLAIVVIGVLAPALVIAFVTFYISRKAAIRLCICVGSSIVIMTTVVFAFSVALSFYDIADEPDWLGAIFFYSLFSPLLIFDPIFDSVLPAHPYNSDSPRLLSVLVTLLFDLALYSLPAICFFVWRDKRQHRRLTTVNGNSIQSDKRI